MGQTARYPSILDIVTGWDFVFSPWEVAVSEYTLHAERRQFQREHSHYKNSVLIMSAEEKTTTITLVREYLG